MVRCKLCNKNFSVITNTHLLAAHKKTIAEYTQAFGHRHVGFARSFAEIAKDDPRYTKWRQTLLRRAPSWSKGYTKETHPSVAKISETFRHKKIDNFASWREKARANGVFGAFKLVRNVDLAYLIGMVLGDGHIARFPRTECLRITLGTDKPELWNYVERIVRTVFDKNPTVAKVTGSECVTITLYQQHISERLGVPTGNRGAFEIQLPSWIYSQEKYLVACLRGLYEAEGTFAVHAGTYTYKMIFVNRNESLLNFVYDGLRTLGFHPHRSQYKVQVSKKAEVFALKEYLQFRNYVK